MLVKIVSGGQTGVDRAAREISDWILEKEIRILNVAGPKASQDRGIYAAAKSLLKTFLYLSRMQAQPPEARGTEAQDYPGTPEDAVERLLSDMSLKEKIRLARMTKTELGSLAASLGEYVQEWYGLRPGNRQLLNALRLESGNVNLDPKGAAAVVVARAWKRVRETHSIRRVK